MEARGEIRGGRFVAGYVGEQFALPDAIDALRAARRNGADAEAVHVGAYDPLALVLGGVTDQVMEVTPAVSRG
jgi:ATP-dependent Lhr-like helicase